VNANPTPLELTPMASATITVRLEETTLSALDQLAAKTERSRDWLVRLAIENFVALEDWRLGKIEAGIAAADRGEFVSDKDLARVKAKFLSIEKFD
jgi:predicted transcriptional regulator